MKVSFVLRLDNDRLREGQIVGEAEHVVTGERGVIGDITELLEFLRRSVAEDSRDQ